MRNLIYLLLINLIILSCSNPIEPNVENNNPDCIIGELDKEISADKIIGEWKLTRKRTLGWDNNNYDLSNENIIYNFQSNGVLIISGSTNLNGFYESGEYIYLFEKDYLSNDSNSNGPMIWLVKIEGEKWTYKSQNDLMVIGQSYVDGSDLCFERKK
jgi:hypothetical protein